MRRWFALLLALCLGATPALAKKPAAADKRKADKGKPGKGKSGKADKGQSGKGKSGKGKSAKADKKCKPGKKKKCPPAPREQRDYENEQKLTGLFEDPGGRFVLEVPTELHESSDPAGDPDGAPPEGTQRKRLVGGSPREELTIDITETLPPYLGPDAQVLLAAELQSWAKRLDPAAEVVATDVHPFRGGFALLATAKLPGAPHGFRWAVRAIFPVADARVDLAGRVTTDSGRDDLERLVRGVALGAQVLKPALLDRPPYRSVSAEKPLLVPVGLAAPASGKDGDLYAFRIALEPGGVCSLHLLANDAVKPPSGAPLPATLLPPGAVAKDVRPIKIAGRPALHATITAAGLTRETYFLAAKTGTLAVWEEHGELSQATCKAALEQSLGLAPPPAAAPPPPAPTPTPTPAKP